ncbi:5'-nucleotidase C-terminal domain-containing protein [Cellulosilyticum sp. I15G10I2]|uniref:5'-nucleotidase C-terminal domain-containing protein n=1 Tax=Cellulosilyticum sp. I15G10I2 TaxID=1892843 RepID=UPI00085C487C|nr:5'-nucleotidase C-terminal domain-containing protein [Cellulosilyticum sp. I15G10I2]
MFKKKSFVSFIALLLMTVLLLPAHLMAAETTPKTITIVYTNDTHSRVEANPGIGFAKIAAKINELRDTNGKENVLVLDAGDTLHGLPIATVTKGEGIVQILNAIGYDAMTPGNHDFNYGQEHLLTLSRKMNFPLISANIKKTDGTTPFVPYIIKEVNGIKLGIFGLSTPETTYKTHPKNVAELTFEDPSKVAQTMVAELQGKTDIIIALSHLGVDESSTYTSEKVAQEVTGIDLIVDGHSHTTLPEGRQIKDTLIVQAGEYGNAIGIVTAAVGADKKVSFSPSLYTKEDAVDAAPDEKLTALISELKMAFDALTGEKIGSTPVKLEGARDFVRTGETNMGNLIVNAMLEATGADVALTNGGGIRASIEAGDITKKDIITVLPFGNYIATLDVTGQEILDALEVGVAGYPDAAGCFPHIGGMTFNLDASKASGSRVSGVKIANKALDLSATYSLATNDFIAAGGDGYIMFSDNQITGEYPGLDEAVISYISAFSVKNIDVQNKITVINNSPKVAIEEVTPIIDTKQTTISDIAIEAKPNFTEYIIQYGDTLAKLAKSAGTTYQELAKLNNISNPNTIFVGNTLLIPIN